MAGFVGDLFWNYPTFSKGSHIGGPIVDAIVDDGQNGLSWEVNPLKKRLLDFPIFFWGWYN